jgi:hypothetical protein
VPDLALNRRWVVSADVIVYGCIAHEALSVDVRPVAMQCVSFLSRASYHGAKLHVPFVFYSEVMTLATRAASQGVIEWRAAHQLIEEAFGTEWDFHIPSWDDVLEFQPRLNSPPSSNTHEAEYLAVARNVGTAVVTTRNVFKNRVSESGIDVPVMLVGDHPWSQPGALDAFPPSD